MESKLLARTGIIALILKYQLYPKNSKPCLFREMPSSTFARLGIAPNRRTRAPANGGHCSMADAPVLPDLPDLHVCAADAASGPNLVVIRRNSHRELAGVDARQHAAAQRAQQFLARSI
jgi:hypothetical protein